MKVHALSDKEERFALIKKREKENAHSSSTECKSPELFPISGSSPSNLLEVYSIHVEDQF